MNNSLPLYFFVIFVILGSCYFQDEEKQKRKKNSDSSDYVSNNRDAIKIKYGDTVFTITDPKKPLAFWTGEIIIGEGKNKGYVELVGLNKKFKSVLLKESKSGLYDFNKHVKNLEIKITMKLQGKNKAPLMRAATKRRTIEDYLNPVLRLHKKNLKDHPIMVGIDPGDFLATVTIERQKGQFLTGRTWSLHPVEKQKYGMKRK